jgi:integrase
MISATIGSSPAKRDGHFHGATLVSTRACQEGAVLVTADKVPADLIRHARGPIVRHTLIYAAYGAQQKDLCCRGKLQRAVACKSDRLEAKNGADLRRHSSLQVTMDLYGRLFEPDDHNEAMDMIAAAMLLA